MTRWRLGSLDREGEDAASPLSRVSIRRLSGSTPSDEQDEIGEVGIAQRHNEGSAWWCQTVMSSDARSKPAPRGQKVSKDLERHHWEPPFAPSHRWQPHD